MSDSNLEPQPKAEAKPAAPRSYTERFLDMENAVNKLIYASNFHTNTLVDVMERMESFLTQVKMLDTVRNTLAAIMKLSERGEPFTLDNVARQVAKLQAESERNRIQSEVDNKALLPIEEVKENSVIAFESLPEIEYGHGTLNSFEGETKTGLLGKKVGDVVGNVKILGVYEINESATEGQSNEPSGQEKRLEEEK